ncbi:MAG: hypothetical protein ABI925_05285, partial [Verrucomicrobiota bacterium]
MKKQLCLALVAAMLATTTLPASARNKTHSKPVAGSHGKPANIETATRLQVFLDRANFSPGALDGHYGEFTLKALALYRQSMGEQPPPARTKPDSAPNTNGLDLASVGPAFIPYIVTGEDLKNIGPLPSAVPAQAKLKFLPYRDAAEAIAEKFHCNVRFLEQLNPGKTKTIKADNQLKVPNVEPFELAAVKNLKPGSEIPDPVANDIPDEPDKDKSAEPGSPGTSVKIDMKTNMLGVFEADKLVAAYPVTVGSAQTVS